MQPDHSTYRLPPHAMAALGTALLAFAAGSWPVSAQVPERYAYDQPGDRAFVSNTAVLERWSPAGSNNQSYKLTADRAAADAAFVDEAIVIDGVREPAWDRATASPIRHRFDAAISAAAPAATVAGTARFLWDGPVLYLLVEVSGDATRAEAGVPAWNTASYAPDSDGLFVFMDVFNDQWGIETDTQGVFFIGANPALTEAGSYNNRAIPSLGSFFHPDNQDYSTRLRAFASSGYRAGPGVNYTYEIALQIEAWGDAPDPAPGNGTGIGIELAVADAGNAFAFWSRSDPLAGREGGSNLPNGERARNRDWGVVTLAGWNGTSERAFSGWRADESIRFWNSKSNPGGSGNGTDADDSGDDSRVWTADTKARMLAAKAAYLALADDAPRADREAAVAEVVAAFAALRWADTRFPDPADLPAVHTLPNVWEFFDHTRGSDGLVTSAAEWDERKQEILELAQFYEYGYKPRRGVDYSVRLVDNSYDGTGNPRVTAQVTPTNARFRNGVARDIAIELTLPSEAAAGRRAPIAFGGDFTAVGLASVRFPAWARDVRTDAGAWGEPNRSGIFYELFPYERNSTTADSSILIANATAVSVYLDVLEAAVAQNAALAAVIDPTQAVTKGFSIGGKIAFVAAVFDERVKVVIAGGAGATGPANWRYNAQGQEYNFSDTIFYEPGAESIVAHGTEGPGNSYRHNRVRETELFRHFMPTGHMYAHEPGSYSYGGYSRLPFDQASLVATLAPDRAIVINTNLNDYNDGSMTDNLSLQIAKSVYRALGVDGDDFVKFNNGNYVSDRDPHGAADAGPEAKYLSDFFFGTSLLTGAEAERLNTDPYALPVSNGRTQSPYDYYWGSYNTITGGLDGIGGRDGWYHYRFDSTP